MRRLPRPSARLLRLVWALAALAVAAAFLPALLPVWAGAAAVLAALIAFDIGSAWRTSLPVVRRDMPHAFALESQREVALVLEYNGTRPLRVQVHDLHPASADAEGMPAAATLQGGTQTRIAWRLRFRERGDVVFPGTHVQIHGRLGLVHCTHTLGESFAARVYPDFAAIAHYALLATDNRLSQLGIRCRQQRGDGLEFRQLRDYRPGDALRQIDSKATSRLRKLISREYQEERDQQIVFLLDCGFRMRSQDNGISHFDASLNAMLLLASVVLRQGDAAGVLTFAGEPRFHAPAKGRSTLAQLMNGLFDLQPTGRTPDFRQLATHCAARVHKRSLLVLMTNLRDEDSDDVIAMAKLLGERHLVLVATLRESVLDEISTTPPENEDAAIRSAAARLFLGERQRALQRLQHAGLLVLDCTPAQLPARLVNTYLDIKRSGKL